MKEKRDKRKIGLGIILRIPLFIILQIIVLFGAAGRIDMPRAWIYFAIVFVYYSIGIVIVHKFNPELLYRRSRGMGKGTKSWDKILMPVIVILTYIQLAVIGFDLGKVQLYNLGINFAILGLIMYIFLAFLGTWTTITNPFFEPTVRIQKDRGHKVITTGPYKFVRHPGYVVAILFPVAITLFMGSALGLIPAVINLILLIVRTYLEDKTLQNELNGYLEYTKKTKYRLFPGIW